MLRDGILRIGQKSLKLAKEPVDDWFMHQGDCNDFVSIFEVRNKTSLKPLQVCTLSYCVKQSTLFVHMILISA